MAIRALKAGKHVLVEKPMTTTAADGEALCKAAEQSRRTAMVAMCMRFSPDYGAAALESAIARAYEAVGHISFEGMFYRKDIGHRALSRLQRPR